MIDKFNFTKENLPRSIFIILNTLFLIFVVLIILFPILKVVADSFDQKASLTEFRILPSLFSLESYVVILTRDFLYKPFLISLYTTSIGTMLSLLITTLFAYALCQKEMPGRNIIIGMVMLTMVFRAGIIPLYFVVRALKLTNSLWSVLLVTCVDAFFLILLVNFFSTIPTEITDAAEIDGCSSMTLFLRIIIPLSKAGIAAIGLFYLVHYWNQFFEYIMFITKTQLYNFQVILRQMVIESETQTFERSVTAVQSLKNAAIIVSIIPVAIIYPFLQKYFVQGVNLGAIK